MPLVPMVIERDGRGERSFDIYSRLLNERIVFVGQPIDDDIATPQQIVRTSGAMNCIVS